MSNATRIVHSSLLDGKASVTTEGQKFMIRDNTYDSTLSNNAIERAWGHVSNWFPMRSLENYHMAFVEPTSARRLATLSEIRFVDFGSALPDGETAYVNTRLLAPFDVPGTTQVEVEDNYSPAEYAFVQTSKSRGTTVTENVYRWFRVYDGVEGFFRALDGADDSGLSNFHVDSDEGQAVPVVCQNGAMLALARPGFVGPGTGIAGGYFLSPTTTSPYAATSFVNNLTFGSLGFDDNDLYQSQAVIALGNYVFYWAFNFNQGTTHLVRYEVSASPSVDSYVDIMDDPTFGNNNIMIDSMSLIETTTTRYLYFHLQGTGSWMTSNGVDFVSLETADPSWTADMILRHHAKKTATTVYGYMEGFGAFNSNVLLLTFSGSGAGLVVVASDVPFVDTTALNNLSTPFRVIAAYSGFDILSNSGTSFIVTAVNPTTSTRDRTNVSGAVGDAIHGPSSGVTVFDDFGGMIKTPGGFTITVKSPIDSNWYTVSWTGSVWTVISDLNGLSRAVGYRSTGTPYAGIYYNPGTWGSKIDIDGSLANFLELQQSELEAAIWESAVDQYDMPVLSFRSPADDAVFMIGSMTEQIDAAGRPVWTDVSNERNNKSLITVYNEASTDRFSAFPSGRQEFMNFLANGTIKEQSPTVFIFFADLSSDTEHSSMVMIYPGQDLSSDLERDGRLIGVVSFPTLPTTSRSKTVPFHEVPAGTRVASMTIRDSGVPWTVHTIYLNTSDGIIPFGTVPAANSSNEPIHGEYGFGSMLMMPWSENIWNMNFTKFAGFGNVESSPGSDAPGADSVWLRFTGSSASTGWPTGSIPVSVEPAQGLRRFNIGDGSRILWMIKLLGGAYMAAVVVQKAAGDQLESDSILIIRSTVSDQKWTVNPQPLPYDVYPANYLGFDGTSFLFADAPDRGIVGYGRNRMAQYRRLFMYMESPPEGQSNWTILPSTGEKDFISTSTNWDGSAGISLKFTPGNNPTHSRPVKTGRFMDQIMRVAVTNISGGVGDFDNLPLIIHTRIATPVTFGSLPKQVNEYGDQKPTIGSIPFSGWSAY